MGNILFNEPDEVVSCKRSDRKRVIKYILFCILMVVCVFLFAAYSVKETETESDTDEYVIYHIQEANDIVMHTTSELCAKLPGSDWLKDRITERKPGRDNHWCMPRKWLVSNPI